MCGAVIVNPVSTWFERLRTSLMQGVMLVVISTSVWGGESPFADQINALRILTDAKIHWVLHDTKFKVPQHELMRVKGRYFFAHQARGNTVEEIGNRGQICAYNPKGYHLLSVNKGQMMFERDPKDPAAELKLSRGNFTVTLAQPLSFLGMVDGDRSHNVFWANFFDDDYVARKTAEVVTKQEADQKGGLVLTIKFKTPGLKDVQFGMNHFGAFLIVAVGINATCGSQKMVNSISYHDPTGLMTGRHEFTYDLVTIPAKDKTPAKSVPMLKSGRLIDPSTGEVAERFERLEADLAANIADEDLVIDPVLAKDIYDAGTGLTFTPDQ